MGGIKSEKEYIFYKINLSYNWLAIESNRFYCQRLTNFKGVMPIGYGINLY